MRNKLLFTTALFGVTLFVVASISGSFQFDNYNHVSQYISETYATGTPYGEALRYYGFIPAGLLLTVFSFLAPGKFPKSRLIRMGFWCLGIFYGMATVVVAVFPCDTGCNKEFVNPSISQLIHNLTGFLTYVFVPVSLLLVGMGLRPLQQYTHLSRAALICGFISILFVGLLFTDSKTDVAGLYQRIIEGSILVWFLFCAFFINRNKQFQNKTT